MFNSFLKDKEYTSCEWLESGMFFSWNGLHHCCDLLFENGTSEPIVGLTSENKYDYKKFFEEKKLARRKYKNGEIPEICKKCELLKTKKWDKVQKISQIMICSFTKCNADCSYCYTHENKSYYNSISDVPVLDFIKENYAKGLISKNCHVEFGGGEPTIYDEFEDIVSFIASNFNSMVKVHSSGIKYSPSLEKCLRENECQIVISVDSGEKELYKRIKNVDKFDVVWRNIRKYCEAETGTKSWVAPKYIIIPNVNDTEQDILNFYKKVAEVNAKRVFVDIEMNWYKANKDDINTLRKLFGLIKKMEEIYKQYTRYFHIALHCERVIKENLELYRSI